MCPPMTHFFFLGQDFLTSAQLMCWFRYFFFFKEGGRFYMVAQASLHLII